MILWKVFPRICLEQNHGKQVIIFLDSLQIVIQQSLWSIHRISLLSWENWGSPCFSTVLNKFGSWNVPHSLSAYLSVSVCWEGIRVRIDKAHRLSISIVICILSSDTICHLNQFNTNSEAAMLSKLEWRRLSEKYIVSLGKLLKTT